MFIRGWREIIVFAGALSLIAPGASAADGAKYPDWKGQWHLMIPRNLGGQGIRFDPSKPWGLGQQAPLTPEYQKVHEASMADQAKGGLGNYPTAKCMPSGMPRMMELPVQEYVVTPDTTYILIGSAPELRRIFTDGRDWPVESEPAYEGYAIGRWLDTDGNGTYDVLEVETRGPFKGPRAYDATGLPLHFDNQSLFKERFYIDRNEPDVLHEDITVFDHALTRPWSVERKFRRSSNPRPEWILSTCPEGNNQIVIGTENYFLSGEGLLMPAKKDQAPPDLRYFKSSQK